MNYVVDKETILAHMHAMVCGYLREMGAPRIGGLPPETTKPAKP